MNSCHSLSCSLHPKSSPPFLSPPGQAPALPERELTRFSSVDSSPSGFSAPSPVCSHFLLKGLAPYSLGQLPTHSRGRAALASCRLSKGGGACLQEEEEGWGSVRGTCTKNILKASQNLAAPSYQLNRKLLVRETPGL